MARREVIEVVCDRCTKKDLQDKKELSDEPEIEISLRGKVITYTDLCARCRDAVTSYVNRITKEEETKTEDKTTPPLAAVPPAGATPAKKGIFG